MIEGVSISCVAQLVSCLSGLNHCPAMMSIPQCRVMDREGSYDDFSISRNGKFCLYVVTNTSWWSWPKFNHILDHWQFIRKSAMTYSHPEAILQLCMLEEKLFIRNDLFAVSYYTVSVLENPLKFMYFLAEKPSTRISLTGLFYRLWLQL